jgi:hypothetical protein
VALATACGGTSVRPLRPEYDLRSPDPELRARAVAHVATQRDSTHVPTLIFLLDDDDGAVRASAAAALENLTGRASAYRAYMDPVERRRHQEEWRAWWASATPPGRSPAGAPGGPVPAPVAPAAGGGRDDGRP